MRVTPDKSDRRSVFRGAQAGEPPLHDLVDRIMGSYRDIAGLSLTLEQAARLFGARTGTCERVFEELVGSGVLDRRDDGRYRLRR